MASRKLLAFAKLPQRKGLLDRVQVDKDVRETMALLELRLRNNAKHRGLTANGWIEAAEAEYAHVGDHTLSGTLELTRDD